MTGLVNSVGGLVATGLKGLLDIAEGYAHLGEGTENVELEQEQASEDERKLPSESAPIAINHPAEGSGSAISSSSSASAASATSATSAMSHLSINQDHLIEIIDVPSGWIHLQSAYIDGSSGERKVKSFGVRNLGDVSVDVEVGSDLGNQIVFWKGDDERDLSSAASYSSASSASNASGTFTLSVSIPSRASITVFLAFTPLHIATPPTLNSPHGSDGGFTPRLQPLSKQKSIETAPGALQSTSFSDQSSISGGSSQSVAGSFKAPSSLVSSRRPDPVYRSSSVHGSITLRANISSSTALSTSSSLSPPGKPTRSQHLALPFFATVCKSLFTAALIDPETGLAAGTQQSSGQMLIDFGSDSIVGDEYHRDILLVNRSEIELVWMTAVVNARYKDSAWFSLRDLDSENVFGVDTSSQPVPLPSLSSRHLRLELRVKQPIIDFSFDFVISNVNQSGNLVTCRAVGSGQAEAGDISLKVLSGSTLDFGQITDGSWAKKLITVKNAGEKPMDVKFSASEGLDVCFRLAGVAGDEDEDIPISKIIAQQNNAKTSAALTDHLALSRYSTKDNRGRQHIGEPHLRSRTSSPTSSIGRPATEGSYLSRDLSLGESPGSDIHTASSLLDSSDKANSGGRDSSRPPSRPLSRAASRSSSYHLHTDDADSDDDENFEPPFFAPSSSTIETISTSTSPAPNTLPVLPKVGEIPDLITDKSIPNQIEELSMRPGTEYRVFALFRPRKDTINIPSTAGQLRQTRFKIYLDSSSSRTSTTSPPKRTTLHATAESCTSLISIEPRRIDFGEVTVGASKSANMTIKNLSQLSAKIEIAAISKVLNTNRNVIVIPPGESVEEKIEFFPRRINERYEKQIFVRNLLNRAGDQLVEIRSKNVDLNNVTLHSHLYRILTPNGGNFLDFGSVVINHPTVKSLIFENLTLSSLVLGLMASQPEDIELYIRAEDIFNQSKAGSGNYASDSNTAGMVERVTSPQNGELKERFIETLRESSKPPTAKVDQSKGAKSKGKNKEKTNDKSHLRHQQQHHPNHKDPEHAPKQSLGAAVASALRKGGRGRPVQLYGNAVVFKDRSLLDSHEHLDLASGPPIAAHRSSPRSKKSALLESIASEDKNLLSGNVLIGKLDFAAGAKASGSLGRDVKKSSKKNHDTMESPKIETFETSIPQPLPLPSGPQQNGRPVLPSIASMISSIPPGASSPPGGKSPALTGKRADQPKSSTSIAVDDLSKMNTDELLLAIEQHDARRALVAASWTMEEEETFVRKTIALRKELQSLISSGRLLPARSLTIQPRSSKQLIVVMTPNGSIRPHVSTRPKRADSRLFIRLNEFDRKYLSSTNNTDVDLNDLPVRDLVMRSHCVRSVLEVQQSSINFGNCEKGEVKSKTIVIQNKSDSISLFRLRTSGSIASGDLKLGLGRYGVISAFGRKEVENFQFTPSLVGNYQENIIIENVLDPYQDQNVSVKANVRKQPNFTVEPISLDFGVINSLAGNDSPKPLSFILTNISKANRIFAVEVNINEKVFADVSLSRDENESGTALSKAEEEEAEGLLQKLKIARRKGKAEKVTKYETRLGELGVTIPAIPSGSEDVDGDMEIEGSKETVSTSDQASGVPSQSQTPGIPKVCVTTLVISLGPSQKTRVSVELLPRLQVLGSETLIPLLNGMIKVFEKKNTDETTSIAISATLGAQSTQIGKVEDVEKVLVDDLGVDRALQAINDPIHLALMRRCLDLTLLCTPVETAFCVGSTLFLPSSSTYFTALKPHFTSFPPNDSTFPLDTVSQLTGNQQAGLILGDGYSRQIPGNTHAEANALTNLQLAYNSLVSATEALPGIQEVLKETECYATMEPCSIRTSGGPSCALELARCHVKTVYLGVEEPPDFVQCEGVKILQDAGVVVKRVVGLEEECLKAARRGRS